MNVVLYHAGSPIPDYLKICVKQIRHYSPDIPIYLITDQKVTTSDVQLDVHVYQLHELDVQIGEVDYFRGEDPLWKQSLFRFFYIKALMNGIFIDNVIHFDNDVLVYSPIELIINDINHLIDEKGLDLAITMHKPEECVCGMMYINNASSLDIVCDYLLKLVKLGKHELEVRLGHMPHEMRLLGLIQNKLKPFIVLPSLPKDVDKIWDEVEMTYHSTGLYDPSSYGQFIGGTHANGGKDAGTVHPDSKTRTVDAFIVADLIRVMFDPRVDLFPRVYERNGNWHKIHNLHIHSKQLEKYKTYK